MRDPDRHPWLSSMPLIRGGMVSVRDSPYQHAVRLTLQYSYLPITLGLGYQRLTVPKGLV